MMTDQVDLIELLSKLIKSEENEQIETTSNCVESG